MHNIEQQQRIADDKKLLVEEKRRQDEQRIQERQQIAHAKRMLDDAPAKRDPHQREDLFRSRAKCDVPEMTLDQRKGELEQRQGEGTRIGTKMKGNTPYSDPRFHYPNSSKGAVSKPQSPSPSATSTSWRTWTPVVVSPLRESTARTWCSTLPTTRLSSVEASRGVSTAFKFSHDRYGVTGSSSSSPRRWADREPRAPSQDSFAHPKPGRRHK